MAIEYTYHGRNRAQDGTGQTADALRANVGNSAAVADAAASSAVANDGWYRIVATSSSRLQYGPSVTNGANGEVWPSGHIEVRYLQSGDKIGVSAGP